MKIVALSAIFYTDYESGVTYKNAVQYIWVSAAVAGFLLDWGTAVG
jgi:hypothetical protein